MTEVAAVDTERPLGVGRYADAVGHCVLVFAFVPTLASLPTWLRFEAGNALDLTDPVVLAFLPVRGVILLLRAFQVGVLPGVLGGLLYGLLMSTLVGRSVVGTATRRGVVIALGGVGGALAALGVVLATVGQVGVASLATGPVLFELASGVVCGMIAAPTAVRLAWGR